MTERSGDWNEGLAQDLQDDEFVREFVAAAIEEGVPLKAVLPKLSAANRTDLAVSLWESLSDQERRAAGQLSNEEKAELDRRWAEHLADPRCREVRRSEHPHDHPAAR